MYYNSYINLNIIIPWINHAIIVFNFLASQSGKILDKHSAEGGFIYITTTTLLCDTKNSFECQCEEGFTNNGQSWAKHEKIANEGVSTTAQPDVCDKKCTDEHEYCVGGGEEYICKYDEVTVFMVTG